jgi:epoxyqueuosine reductase
MLESQKERYSRFIKERADNAGFLSCGISHAGFLEEEAPRLEAWLNSGFHGDMGYMERNFDKRLDPRKLVPGAKSVVSLLYNYYPSAIQREDAPKLSKYAFGEDYHFVIKDKLKALLEEVREEVGDVQGRCFVDSAPVLDKAWAARSGLGWIGKHTNLLSQQVGSFYFIAELIIDLELAADRPTTDHCGSCTRCLDACPTDAIVEPYVVDGSKCISYFTIELKDSIPETMKGQLEDWMFGCDVCQDVCPWNRFSIPSSEERFQPSGEFLEWGRDEWMELTQEVFESTFGRSAIKRKGFDGLKSTLAFLGE